MPLFNVAVREHTYTGRFYGDVVQASSPEEALQVAAQHAVVPGSPAGPGPQHGSVIAATGPSSTGRLDTDVVPTSRAGEPVPAAVPRPPPGPAPQGFSVVVRGQADAGSLRSDVVQAGSPEEALHVAAAQAAAEPPPGPTPQAVAAGGPRCADVWVYALLHCDLEAGHDPPHMTVARGYRRPVRWMRDELGIAHLVPDPATGAPGVSPVTQPSPAPEAEPPRAPLTGAGP